MIKWFNGGVFKFLNHEILSNHITNENYNERILNKMNKF